MSSRLRRRPAAAGPRQPRARDEVGGATVFVVLLAVALMAAAGLVIDGGYALAARREAMNQAEQAARVASDQLSQASLRSGLTSVQNAKARTAAQSYLASAGAAGTVDIGAGGRVSVTVRTDYRPAVLSMLGVSSIDVSANATAVSVDEDDTP